MLASSRNRPANPSCPLDHPRREGAASAAEAAAPSSRRRCRGRRRPPCSRSARTWDSAGLEGCSEGRRRRFRSGSQESVTFRSCCGAAVEISRSERGAGVMTHHGRRRRAWTCPRSWLPGEEKTGAFRSRQLDRGVSVGTKRSGVFACTIGPIRASCRTAAGGALRRRPG